MELFYKKLLTTKYEEIPSLIKEDYKVILDYDDKIIDLIINNSDILIDLFEKYNDKNKNNENKKIDINNKNYQQIN